MSRLDSAIRRLEAQRRCLDWACDGIAGRDGLVLELGLGNGRTYDHLRDRIGAERIYVFDRTLACHPNSRPDPKWFFQGEIAETVPAFAKTVTDEIILVHLDLGAGEAAETAANLRDVGTALIRLIAPGGIVVADQPLEALETAADFRMLPLPTGIPKNRYFIYCKA